MRIANVFFPLLPIPLFSIYDYASKGLPWAYIQVYVLAGQIMVSIAKV